MAMVSNKHKWLVYILECADNSLYTGITTDIHRRMKEHNSDVKGAHYTRMRRPVKLVFQQPFENRSTASKQEYAIKRLSRKQKQELIAKSKCEISAAIQN